MRYCALFVFVLTLFGSCKNDVSQDVVKTSRSKILSQYLYLDVFRQALAVVPEFVAEGKKAGSTVTVTASSSFANSAYPKTVTIDYGSANQQDAMGINRRGKIEVTILSNKITKGDFKITFDRFYLNDTRVLGELSSSYVGSVSADDYNLVLLSSCKIANGNGTMSYNGAMSFKMIKGKQTFNVFDDIYTLSEETEGQDFSGRTFSAASTTDYTLDFSCRWIMTAGEGEVNGNDIPVQTLNMGSGSCDGVVVANLSTVLGEDDLISFQVQ